MFYDDNLKMRGIVDIVPYERFLDGRVVKGDPINKDNLVVNSGRDFVVRAIADTTYDARIRYIATGTSNLPPVQSDTALKQPVSFVSGTTPRPIDSFDPPTILTIGKIVLKASLLGSYFPPGNTDIFELGLFISQDGDYNNFDVPAVMFSRIVFSTPITVHPFDGSSERGFTCNWSIQT